MRYILMGILWLSLLGLFVSPFTIPFIPGATAGHLVATIMILAWICCAIPSKIWPLNK